MQVSWVRHTERSVHHVLNRDKKRDTPGDSIGLGWFLPTNIQVDKFFRK